MFQLPTNARTLRIHPANWVDHDLVTVEVEEGNRFRVHGDLYWIEEITDQQGQDDIPTDDPYYAHVYKVRGEGWSDGGDLGTIVIFNTDVTRAKKAGRPLNYTCTSMGFARDHTDPVGAAAQMILHTV